jgi:serine/threonine protein kinase
MRVNHISCGQVANESETKAIEFLKNALKSVPGDSEWILLTNLFFSVNNQAQSEEIDIVALGPTGVTVLEVKHWSQQWVDDHANIVDREADKVSMKARKIGTTLRRSCQELKHVPGRFLLTQDSAAVQELKGMSKRGVQFFGLQEWKKAIEFESPTQLTGMRVRALSKILEPRSGVALEGDLRRFGGLVNLELLTPRDQRFHRVYKGRHSVRQDRVILHIFDLSAYDGKNARQVASREFEALLRLQRFQWAARILDSFQDAPGYFGEMCFFTIVDPAAPTLKERSRDKSFETVSKLAFAKATCEAVHQLHESAGEPLIHRNLTPHTILVRHDGTPVLGGLHLVKIPTDVTVASAPVLSPDWDLVAAPETKAKGLAFADQRSDIYSLCASLKVLFEANNELIAKQTMDVLDGGMSESPDQRRSLPELVEALGTLLGDSTPPTSAPPARYWTEEQVIFFRDRNYRIVTRLGGGGVGATFKVVEIDRETKDELGTYVAKVVFAGDVGTKVLRSYSLARSHLGRQSSLSAIYEIAREWREDNFVALMTWVEGTPLSEFLGVFPLLAEDQAEASVEDLATRWLLNLCQALQALHSKGLIHGDVSLRNLIVSGNDLVLTDYDFVTKIAEASGPGTILYSSHSVQNGLPVSPSDDLYALAASFFHVVFNREPFQHGGVRANERGLNWQGLNREEFPKLTSFFDKATHPSPDKRFSSAKEAIEHLSGTERKPIIEELREEKIEWLMSVLQSYPGSPRWGNRETRGLDSPFAEQTYVETGLEEVLVKDILERRTRLVVLCGNAGDGKTALLQNLASRMGFGHHSSSERIIEHKVKDGLQVRINLDGSASWQGRSADELLNEFLAPFHEGAPSEDIAHLLAINDGRLLEWIGNVEARSDAGSTALTEDLLNLVEARTTGQSHIRFINLNLRSLVGGVHVERSAVTTEFLDRLLDRLYGGDNAGRIWRPCQTCVAKSRCQIYKAHQMFGPSSLHSNLRPEVRSRARRRLFEALQAVHQRGEVHITTRELRAALVYILFGLYHCTDYHEHRSDGEFSFLPYWDLAFSPTSPERQGEVLRELIRFDPALEAHPQIDRHLLSDSVLDERESAPRYGAPLNSARRRAYFEWTEDQVFRVARDKNALGVARGQHLDLFKRIPLMSPAERDDLCRRLCRGISRLEDLPSLALSREDVVPLRITPKTPTETAFWVEKPLQRFRIEADLPAVVDGLEVLHRQVNLIYHYNNDLEECLRMGAELFHLLLELSEGYQLGDAASDDTFAHLSIFVQRLAQEDERILMAWNPMQDETSFRITSEPADADRNKIQRLVLSETERGDQT